MLTWTQHPALVLLLPYHRAMRYHRRQRPDHYKVPRSLVLRRVVSVAAHVKRLQKRPVAWTAGLSAHPPIVVTNNFDNNSDLTLPHVKLMRITFQNLFPAVNVSTVKLSECRRVVLFDLIEEQQRDNDNTKRTLVQVRHYAIQATPTHVNRRVRRLVQTKNKLPNLSKINDIADYLGNAYQSEGVASDSELDDDGAVVQLSDQYVGRGNSNAASQQSALKLVEIGPRLSLELTKVKKGLGTGDVMYHAFVHKTPAEAAALHSKAAAATARQQKRRTTQEEKCRPQTNGGGRKETDQEATPG